MADVNEISQNSEKELRQPSEEKAGTKFQLKQTSEAFSDRCRDIFAALNESSVVPPGHSGDHEDTKEKISSSKIHRRSEVIDEEEDPVAAKNDKRNTRYLKNQESIFRISDQEQMGWPPPPPTSRSSHRRSSESDHTIDRRHPQRDSSDRSHQPPRRHHRAPRIPPAHVLHPERFTKYSLADTPGVSDRSNTKAALNFLQEIRDRKAASEREPGRIEDKGQKVTFKKPSAWSKKPAVAVSVEELGASGSSVSNELPATPGSSKRLLPEVQVGSKARPKGGQVTKGTDDVAPKRSKTAETSGNRMVLSHLSCVDDED